MKIEPDSGPDQCEIHGHILNFRLTVDGLSNADLTAFLRSTHPRPDWLQLAARKPVTVDNPAADQPLPTGPIITRDMDDGKLTTRSGGPGQISTEPHHQTKLLLLPQSLHLLLCQQWARGGIMPVHAAAIITPTTGILVIGPRGGGKSVLTLSALAAGHAVISDDWILLGVSDEQKPQVERLRPFLMLRQSWATDQLKARVSQLNTQTTNHGKQTIELPEQSQRFPTAGSIDQVWLLKRPRSARGTETTSKSINPTTVLGRLIEAGMPLLFSSTFPAEHQALIATARQLLASTQCMEVETGTDIVNEPEKAWARLVDH